MSNMRMILIEATLVAGVLTAGLTVSQDAYAAPLATAAQAAAADPMAAVKIDSSIRVERAGQSGSGETVTSLLDPATVKVVPGDSLLFTNHYRNNGETAVTGFVVNNPVHKAVTFVEVLEDWALVSIDGGQNFGKLSELVATDADQNSRPAVASDVTHIRWVLQSPIAPGASGDVHFRGTVK